MSTTTTTEFESKIELGHKDQVLDLLKTIDREATAKYIVFQIELGPNEFKLYLAETPKYAVLIYKVKEGRHKPVYVIDIMSKEEFKHLEEELSRGIQEYLKDTIERVGKLGFSDVLRPVIPYIGTIIKRILNTPNLESILPRLREPLYEI